MIERAVDAALEALIPIGYTSPGYAMRRRLFDWPPLSTFDLSDRVIVVTGATSGLGAELARCLAGIGAQVVIVGRNAERAAGVQEGITQMGDQAARGVPTPIVELADIGSLADVASLADRLSARFARIDGLVHNAGAMMPERQLTEDGFESTFATMVAGPHLLTSRLRAVLDDGRVVWMTSGGLYSQRLHLDDLQVESGYRPATAYARAKRAQVDLVGEWARRHPSLFSAAVHPGWSDTPGVVDSMPRFHRLLRRVLRSPAQGVDTAAWLCASSEPLISNGALWFDRRPRGAQRIPGTATSPTDRQRLFDAVQHLTGLA